MLAVVKVDARIAKPGKYCRIMCEDCKHGFSLTTLLHSLLCLGNSSGKVWEIHYTGDLEIQDFRISWNNLTLVFTLSVQLTTKLGSALFLLHHKAATSNFSSALKIRRKYGVLNT